MTAAARAPVMNTHRYCVPIYLIIQFVYTLHLLIIMFVKTYVYILCLY